MDAVRGPLSFLRNALVPISVRTLLDPQVPAAQAPDHGQGHFAAGVQPDGSLAHEGRHRVRIAAGKGGEGCCDCQLLPLEREHLATRAALRRLYHRVPPVSARSPPVSPKTIPGPRDPEFPITGLRDTRAVLTARSVRGYLPVYSGLIQ